MISAQTWCLLQDVASWTLSVQNLKFTCAYYLLNHGCKTVSCSCLSGCRKGLLCMDSPGSSGEWKYWANKYKYLASGGRIPYTTSIKCNTGWKMSPLLIMSCSHKRYQPFPTFIISAQGSLGTRLIQKDWAQDKNENGYIIWSVIDWREGWWKFHVLMRTYWKLYLVKVTSQSGTPVNLHTTITFHLPLHIASS